MRSFLKSLNNLNTNKSTVLSLNRLILINILCRAAPLDFNNRNGQRAKIPTPVGYSRISPAVPNRQSIRLCLLQSFRERGPPTIPSQSRPKSVCIISAHW
jgi:hypothetical protein